MPSQKNQDEIIRVGDLVMVVKPLPCCGSPIMLGEIFTIAKVTREFLDGTCNYCGYWCHETVDAAKSETRDFVFTNRLKKIPPLSPEEKYQELEAVIEALFKATNK